MMKQNRTLDISVLIATRDRARLLERTLDHLQRQVLSNFRWELLVVDNGSIDDTTIVLSQAQGRLPLGVIQEPIPGKNRSLNRALDIACGDLLVFTDDDIEPSPQWLAELFAASHRWPSHCIFCGPIIPMYPRETPLWLRDHPFSVAAYTKFTPMIQEGQLPDDLSPFGPNYAVRSNALGDLRFCEKFGPQGENYPMGGEVELLRRLRTQCGEVIYVPSATVKHFVGKHQIEYEWLFQRAFKDGRGVARLNYQHQAYGLDVLITLVKRALLETESEQAGNLSGNELTRFEKGIKQHYLQGVLYEYRMLASEVWEGKLLR